MKEGRKKLLGKKVKEHGENLALISKMEKKERKILEDLYKADEMEREIGKMISVEESMEGDDLSKLYRQNWTLNDIIMPSFFVFQVSSSKKFAKNMTIA